jgi:hypothetical protein
MIFEGSGRQLAETNMVPLESCSRRQRMEVRMEKSMDGRLGGIGTRDNKDYN